MTCEYCKKCVDNATALRYNGAESNKMGGTKMNEYTESEMQMIPFTIHESDMARSEKDKDRLSKINMRQWVTILVLIVMLVATNIFWIWRETQYEDIRMTQEATTDGGGDVVLNGVASGDIYYDQGKTNNQDPASESRGQ